MINLENLGEFDNLEDLNREIQKRMILHNQKKRNEFEGLSPEQMRGLELDFPQKKSLLVINTLPESDLQKCPLLVQTRFLMSKMRGGKEVKLTKTGALPRNLTKEIYELGMLKNWAIEKGITNLNKEGDAVEISITRVLLELTSLVKKRKGRLSLNRKGEQSFEDGNAILEEILLVLFRKFNWAYYDRYRSQTIGRVIPGFSLYLVKKYGDRKRSAHFYAEKYFKAFPQLLDDQKWNFHCYSWRTLELYFRVLGFVHVEKETFLEPVIVRKTEFLDRLVSLRK